MLPLISFYLKYQPCCCVFIKHKFPRRRAAPLVSRNRNCDSFARYHNTSLSCFYNQCSVQRRKNLRILLHTTAKGVNSVIRVCNSLSISNIKHTSFPKLGNQKNTINGKLFFHFLEQHNVNLPEEIVNIFEGQLTLPLGCSVVRMCLNKYWKI